MIECIKPDEIEEGDLLAYADGEANAAVQAHVRRCAYCTNQVAIYSNLERRLLIGLYRTNCPDPDTLAHWQLHLLPANEELRVAAHTRICLHCSRELAELNVVDDGLLTSLLAQLPDVMGWIEAKLMVTTPQAAGLRRSFPTNQKRYYIDNLDIFVGAQPIGKERRLVGRLHPTSDSQNQVNNLPVWLAQKGEVLADQTTDKQGRFIFTNVSSGQYDLGFGWQGKAIIIRDVEVQ